VANGNSGTEALEKVGRHVLAACCILGPLLFAYIAFTVVVDWQLPKDSLTKFNIEYAPQPLAAVGRAGVSKQASPPHAADVKGGSNGVSSAPAADATSGSNGTSPPVPADAKSTGQNALPATDAKNGSKDVSADPVILRQSGEFAWLFGYATASTFLYLVSAAAVLFGCWIVGSRLGPLSAGISVGAFAALAAGVVAIQQDPFELGRPLVLDKVLEAIQKESPLLGNLNSGAQVHWHVMVNGFVGLLGVGLLLSSLYALSLPPPDTSTPPKRKNDLVHRLTRIRWALLLGSAILVMGSLAANALISWPYTLLVEAQTKALKPIVDTLNLYVGTVGTIALVAAFTPAIFAWFSDLSTYRDKLAESLPPGQDPSANDPALSFAPTSLLTSALAVVAPLLASPLAAGLKQVVSLLP
jgi:hypothetical protein